MRTKVLALATVTLGFLSGCIIEGDGGSGPFGGPFGGASGGAALGAPCETALDCGVAACCFQGACRASTSAAPGPCGQQSDCPTGSVCQAGSCETSCSQEAPCGAGLSCDPVQQICVGGTGGGYWTSTGGSNSGGGGGVGTSNPGGSGSSGSAAGGPGTSSGSGGAAGGPTTSNGGGTSAGTSGCGCPPRDLSQVPVGAACQSDSDCGPNGLCQPPLDLSNGVSPTEWAHGYCTARNCDTSTPCPEGSECFFYPQGGTPEAFSLCLASCGTAACRRPGYTCSAVGDPVYACLPECAKDLDCGPGLVCDSGACAPPCQASTGCAAGEICSSGHCQAGPPESCGACQACPTGQSCQAGECARACAVDSDCPIGERCACSGFCG